MYVFDFITCSIYEIEINEEDADKEADLLEEYGLNENECCYMYSSKKLELESIEKVK